MHRAMSLVHMAVVCGVNQITCASSGFEVAHHLNICQSLDFQAGRNWRRQQLQVGVVLIPDAPMHISKDVLVDVFIIALHSAEHLEAAGIYVASMGASDGLVSGRNQALQEHHLVDVHGDGAVRSLATVGGVHMDRAHCVLPQLLDAILTSIAVLQLVESPGRPIEQFSQGGWSIRQASHGFHVVHATHATAANSARQRPTGALHPYVTVCRWSELKWLQRQERRNGIKS